MASTENQRKLYPIVCLADQRPSGLHLPSSLAIPGNLLLVLAHNAQLSHVMLPALTHCILRGSFFPQNALVLLRFTQRPNVFLTIDSLHELLLLHLTCRTLKQMILSAAVLY